MNNLSFLFIIGLFLCACEGELLDGPGIVGTYRLTAELFDPGDGSGTFQAVDSRNTLQFLQNGEVISNWNMCRAQRSLASFRGRYNGSEIEVVGIDCGSITYQYVDEEVILILPCIEACMLKFSRN